MGCCGSKTAPEEDTSTQELEKVKIPPLPKSASSAKKRKKKRAKGRRMNLESFARQIGFGRRSRDNVILQTDSEEDDSDALDAAEEEAKLEPVTRKHVEAYDKIKRRHRFIDPDLYKGEFSSEDDVAASEAEQSSVFTVTEQDFIALFRAHVKRKKLRRKIRTNPDFEEVSGFGKTWFDPCPT